MTPTEIVELLNEVFSHFDTLVDKYGLEKIKTIGDCYMVAAGVPRPRADHAQALTRMALEMRDYVSGREFHGRRLAFRIGLNSGPVVAGVIGRKKFIYDLWGDAVNTASRMESHGQGGIIQITRATYELVKDEFVCEPRGTMNVKGKGEMEVWFVTGERRHSSLKPAPLLQDPLACVYSVHHRWAGITGPTRPVPPSGYPGPVTVLPSWTWLIHSSGTRYEKAKIITTAIRYRPYSSP